MCGRSSRTIGAGAMIASRGAIGYPLATGGDTGGNENGSGRPLPFRRNPSAGRHFTATSTRRASASDPVPCVSSGFFMSKRSSPMPAADLIASRTASARCFASSWFVSSEPLASC